MDVVKEEDKQVVDMNETKESQGFPDDPWKPSIGEKLSICNEDGAVWTVGVLEEENKVIAKPPFGKEEEIVRGEDGVWKGDVEDYGKKETKTFVMKRLQAPEEDADWKPSVIGERVCICDENGRAVSGGALEESTRVVAKSGDAAAELLLGEDGKWKCKGKVFIMKKPKTIDHVRVGENDLAGATLTEANLREATLTNANLFGATLSNADLEGAILTKADLREATLTNANLFGATLSNADLEGATLTKADLVQATLTEADLRGATLTGADLRRATLTEAYLGGATLTKADLVQATLTEADLRGATLTGADLRRATLTEAYLGGATLTNANLEGATLTNANLEGATLTKANLGEATLTKARLAEATLTKADLCEAILTEAKLEKANLTEADLSGATLTEADLREATLTEADLRNATLTKARLWKATLTEAKLHVAILTEANLSGATLTNANLEGATLTKASLFKATLTEADLDKTDFTGATFDKTKLEGAKNVEKAIFNIYVRKPPKKKMISGEFSDENVEKNQIKDQVQSQASSQVQSPRSASAKVAAGNEDQELQDMELGLVQPITEPKAEPQSEFAVLEDEKMSFKDLYCLKIPVPKVGVIMKELILIATCNPQKLSTYSDEIVLATRMIERLYDYEMSDSNWREAITLIKSFYDLELRLKNEKARYILSQLYEENIAMVIGMGIQLDNIDGKAPDGVLFRIKQVTKHIRDNYLDQITEMNEEQARINAIKEYQGIFQQRMFALFVAVGVGIANFISRFLYNRYVGDNSE